MADFYTEQKRNRRVTAALILGLSGLLAAVGYSVDAYAYGELAIRGVPVATLIALSFAGLNGATAYLYGDRIVLSSLHAVPLVFDNPTHKKLHNVVSEMALASGLRMPRIYVIADPAPNAFATGRSPDRAAIGITQGLLDSMNREELQGVVAHEMGHIKHNDILTMTVVTVLLGAIVLLCDWAIRVWRYGGVLTRSGSRSKSLHPLALLVIILLIYLSPLLSRIIAMAVSRQREYLADAGAAEFTRNPLALASALEKIAAASSPLAASHRATAHLFISDPLQRRLDDREGFFANLFSTHPPIRIRIHRLKTMGYLHAKPEPDRAGSRG